VIRWHAPTRGSLLRQPAAVAGLIWLALATALALVAPVLAPDGPYQIDTLRLTLPPGPGRPLGTDLLGRDVSARIVWGARWTLILGLTSIVVTVGIGLPMGLAAGLLGGWTEAVLMRVVDALLAFPGLLLAMATVAVLGPGIWPVSIAVGLSAAPAFARVARTAALDVASQPYIDAARSIGGSRLRILTHHVVPNTSAPLLSFAATQLGWVLLNGAALSFLGLGAPPGHPEWGAMLAEGRAILRDAPWVSLYPGLALTATVLAANVVGDGILEAMRTG
jgi:peptide/nickel transport system permease protein